MGLPYLANLVYFFKGCDCFNAPLTLRLADEWWACFLFFGGFILPPTLLSELASTHHVVFLAHVWRNGTENKNTLSAVSLWH